MSTGLTLVQKIKARQDERGIKEEAFAAMMGVSRAQWYLIKRGDRKPSAGFLKAVIRHFPELTLDVMNYLSASDPLAEVTA